MEAKMTYSNRYSKSKREKSPGQILYFTLPIRYCMSFLLTFFYISLFVNKKIISFFSLTSSIETSLSIKICGSKDNELVFCKELQTLA